METLLEKSTDVRPLKKNKELFYILIFKTNIRFKKDIKSLGLFLNKNNQVYEWNVDMQDCDKILRVKSYFNNSYQIINLITKAGFYCEELAD